MISAASEVCDYFIKGVCSHMLKPSPMRTFLFVLITVSSAVIINVALYPSDIPKPGSTITVLPTEDEQYYRLVKYYPVDE